MAKKFALGTLLKVRKEQEEEARSDVMRAEQIIREIEEEVTSLRQQIDDAEENYRIQQREAPGSLRIIEHFEYVGSLQTGVELQEDRLMKAQNIVAQLRSQLMEAVKNRKIIENLRDKQQAEWEQKERELENKFLDEQANIQYNRLRQK